MRFRTLGVVAGTALLLLSALLSVAQDNAVLVGKVAAVTDGDTIKVQLSSGPITVRLDSIDAPESKQSGGPEANAALAGRVAGKEVELKVVTQDRYERLVADVYVGEDNVNEWMVKQGHAWAYRQYADDPAYCVWEDGARRLKRGLWAEDQWIAPWEWQKWQRDKEAVITDYSDESAARCIAAMK